MTVVLFRSKKLERHLLAVLILTCGGFVCVGVGVSEEASMHVCGLYVYKYCCALGRD